MTESRFKEKPACSIKSVVPDTLFCKSCSYENEVWSDEENPVCKECGKPLKS
ncbi:hypothetical protein [Candidatus Magnetomonas plexicatena]|uniref:hypothetical protein n=1 Tax=Candidatus Magnetomonas plexicatena TaxID=2552947 RepID=UPI001C785096|nr:MucR family transcriptional regulator [Nitrospirales bacterium LBB_01]